jgi:mono/diheme cytochrome c family protein
VERALPVHGAAEGAEVGVRNIHRALWIAAVLTGACTDPDVASSAESVKRSSLDGQTVFREYTFGDERHWTRTLRMHEVISSSVSPMTALSVGLKVDSDALPTGILDTADLNDPRTTVALVGLGAVVGVRGHVDDEGNLIRVGITCALCHSTVDDSVLPGIGRRLDGWPNRDLDPGFILSLSPAFDDEQVAELRSWGPGYYDPRWSVDGISDPVLIPPAYGLADVELETYTGDGPISYWNAYVAITQMGGLGTFIDPRIDVSVVRHPELVAPVLPALLAYQLGLPAPPPPPGLVDEAAAERGRGVFEGQGRCASCHVPPSYTDVDDGILHAPEETGMDGAYAARSATGLYRTTPLRALWQHPPYFHDGSAATLAAVVAHYDGHFELGLTAEQQADLVEFLESL